MKFSGGFFRKLIAALLVASFSYLGLIKCYGSFALTKVVWGVGQKIQNKWVRQILFILLIWLAGAIAFISILLDIIIFNLVEFWSGKNLISHADYDKNGEFRKTAVRGTAKSVFVYKKYGAEMEVQLYRDGKLLKTMAVKRSQPGVLYAVTGDKLERLEATVEKTVRGERVTLYRGGKAVKSRVLNARESAFVEERSRAIKTPQRLYAEGLPAGGSL